LADDGNDDFEDVSDEEEVITVKKAKNFSKKTAKK
jgi:hypothetical protein